MEIGATIGLNCPCIQNSIKWANCTRDLKIFERVIYRYFVYVVSNKLIRGISNEISIFWLIIECYGNWDGIILNCQYSKVS